MIDDIQILIIPDVHGRRFWLEAIEAQLPNPNVQIVFLGDYVDPYPYEKISEQQALEGLKDIIAFKKAYPDRIHLLLGNHDLSYLDISLICTRHSWALEKQIKRILEEEADCFEMAWEAVVAGKRYLFSHAGVSRGWIEWNDFTFGNAAISADLLNNMYKGNDPRLYDLFMYALADVSPARGGGSKYGSMIWADAREMMDPKAQLPGIIQIFGHTQQVYDPVVLPGRAFCLDCRRPFYIDSEGTVGEVVQY